MVRIFLVAFYLHKFIVSAFCAWLEQWGLTVSIVFFLVEEQSTLSVGSLCFATHNFRWKTRSLCDLCWLSCPYWNSTSVICQLWFCSVMENQNWFQVQCSIFPCLEIMEVWSIPYWRNSTWYSRLASIGFTEELNTRKVQTYNMYRNWAQNCVSRLVAFYVLLHDDIPVVGWP